MQSFGGQNTHIINERHPDDILDRLSAIGITRAHFTNGAFTLPKPVFTPQMLAAQKFVLDHTTGDEAIPIITAINSDESMLVSYAGKPNEQELKEKLVPQQVRAESVLESLHLLFPKHSVVAIFYPEETPVELYTGFKKEGFGMRSIYKNGYGTNSSDKPIVGAALFDAVFAFPLFNDEKPVMHGDTRDANETDRRPDVVAKLTEVMGPHGRPYITTAGKLLFDLPPGLQQYAAPADHVGLNANPPIPTR